MKPTREQATNNSQTYFVTSKTWESRHLFRAEPKRIAASKTNDKGEFSIQAPPGKYWLVANSRAFAPGEAYISLGIDLLTLVKSSHLWMILKAGVANDDCTFTATSRRQFEKAILKRPQGI